MSGRISKASVDTVIAKASIETVVGEYVRLQRTGTSLKGLCPFHSERTPSFNVSPEKGVYYCFGCQKGGNAISFLMELEKFSFKEAVEHLAERFGIPIEYEGAGEDQAADAVARQKADLYHLYERLTKTFRFFLIEHESGQKAREYLASRGVNDEMSTSFGLGYTPRDRSWLYDFLGSKGYSADFLAQSGLFSRNNPHNAFFSGRLMFPIADMHGKVVAFGGRILEGDGPKYINSPETPIFSKQAILYGYSVAAPAIRSSKQAIICEGYMDVLAYHRAGLANAVAPLGTAFTFAQAALLKRSAETVILAFDSDEAGLKATEKALLIAEREGIVANVLTIEGGKDAAELLEKEGAEQLHKISNLTINASDFMVKRAVSLFDPGNTASRAKAVQFLFPYLESMASDIRRDDCIEKAAAALHADKASILFDFWRFRSGAHESNEMKPDQGNRGVIPGLDLQIMAAVAVHGEHFPFVRSVIGIDDLEERSARDVFLALEESYRRDETGLDAILSRIEDGAVRSYLLEKMTLDEYTINIERWIRESCLRIRARTLRRRREKVVTLLNAVGHTPEEDGISQDDLIYESMYLNTELAALEVELARLKDVSNERS
ncbi:MAG: DNA primase [Spirochaetes bacterium]|nr:DNA primase [Spirochaetota bacterium]